MVAGEISLAGTPREGLAGPHVVLIEDDDADALLVRELLSEASADLTLVRARSMAEAQPRLARAQCVLLDLQLPDARGLDGLHWLQEHVPGVAVVVLTGMAGEHLGVAAVRAGAQDYLLKGQVSGELLHRVIRYAIERRRSEETQRQLREAQLSAQENTRLERGLLPVPLVTDPRFTITARYRPGGGRMLLGGDFYDVVETAGGWVHAMVGDVCGRGPDEAALGVCLRVAWRTLVLASRPTAEILTILARLLEHERHHERIFTTLCMLSVAPERDRALLHLAGHPPPLLLAPGGPVELRAPVCLPLGMQQRAGWASGESMLRPPWAVLLYTDGLVEGRAGAGAARLNSEGLIGLIRTAWPAGGPGAAGTSPPAEAMLDGLIDEVCERNGGPLDDDLAVVLLQCAAQG